MSKIAPMAARLTDRPQRPRYNPRETATSRSLQLRIMYSAQDSLRSFIARHNGRTWCEGSKLDLQRLEAEIRTLHRV
jgi:hypothetical protein